MPYRANPAHDPHSSSFNPRKTPEPSDAASVYERSLYDGEKHWYGLGSNNEIYRFSPDNAGGVHFTGMTGGTDGIKLDRIAIEIRRGLG